MSDDFDDDDDRLDDAEESDASSGPRPKTAIFTIVLAFLNVGAALAFSYLLMMDYQVRQSWTYAAFLHDLKIYGLPTAEDEKGDGLSAGALTQTRPRLTAEMLREAFKSRGGTLPKDEFQAIDQAPRSPIRVSQLDPEILKDHFKDLSDPVSTLEEEIERLKLAFPKGAFDAAQEYAAAQKGDDDKRNALLKLQLPLCTNIVQLRAVAKKIQETPAAQLEGMLAETVRRRMFRDFLAPFELFRPGELGGFTINKAGDLDNMPLAQLEERVKLRLDAAKGDKHFGKVYLSEAYDGKDRWSIDKRQQIAFALVDVANVRKPDGKLLFPKGMERAETISGLADFVLACVDFARTFPKLERQAIEAIQVDREGYDLIYKGNPDRTLGFVGQLDAEVHRIRNLTVQTKQDEERTKLLEAQLDQAKKTYKERSDHLDDAVRKLLVSRSKTAKQAEELREFQRQLFQAQLELAEAAEKNFAIEAQIRLAEGLKGGTAP